MTHASAGSGTFAAAPRDDRVWRPRTCVWELTLACNLRCVHCGSDAGQARSQELDTGECLGVVEQLADLGCQLLTLSGGEPTLRPDWDAIAARASARGLLVNMVTNGVHGSTRELKEVAARARRAGLVNVGISVDGPAPVHDALRGPGTFQRSLEAVAAYVAEGVKVCALATVTRANLHCLEALADLVQAAGATQLRFQLGVPTGGLARRRDLLLTQRQLPGLLASLTALKQRAGLKVAVGDNLGWLGPQDGALRGSSWRNRSQRWRGCQAGLQTVGLRSDGGVLGCLALQAGAEEGDPFLEGNLRQQSLASIWGRPGAFAYNRDFQVGQLSGACRACPKALLCRGGARCAASAFGQLWEDPFCDFHQQSLAGSSLLRRSGAVAAAAALALGALAPACGGDPANRSGLEDLSEPDAGLQDGAAFDGAAGDLAGADAGQPETQVETASDTVDCDTVACACSFMLSPSVVEACCSSPQDAVNEADGIDCDEICCDVIYGVPPELAAAFEFCCKK